MDSGDVFSVLCVSEHWMVDESVCGDLVLGEYRVVSSFVRKNHIYGGVLLLGKNNLDFMPLQAVNSVSTELHCEISCVICKSFNIVVVCMYVLRAVILICFVMF